MIHKTDDLRIKNLKPITSPALLLHDIVLTDDMVEMIARVRDEAASIINGKDDRLLVVVGPCSIHDTKAALEYASRLKNVMDKHQKELCIIMRVYFEKPRTTVGWKGLINDPHLDGQFDINEGLKRARQLLVDLAGMGVPAGTEFLDTIIPQFISDVITWGAIGARTTESQVHRELASGLSMPIGFKNGTDGNIRIAVDAVYSARHPHHFLSISKLGVPVIAETAGNETTHIILRGSTHGPNYDEETIHETVAMLEKRQLPVGVMVDCSHGNSNKDYERQAEVAREIMRRIAQGNRDVFGLMLESHLKEGNQSLVKKEDLTYGQSITDACMNWETTEVLLGELAEAVKQRRQR